MNQPSRTDTLALRADEVARRFERICRREVAGCQVGARVNSGGEQIDLEVASIVGGRSEALSVSGLDRDSWADIAGMESLARVVGIWMAAPESDVVVQARQDRRRGPVRRPVHKGRSAAAGHRRLAPVVPGTQRPADGRVG